jgi:hypothetical protein
MSEAPCPVCGAPGMPLLNGVIRCQRGDDCILRPLPTDVWRRLASAVALAAAVERLGARQEFVFEVMNDNAGGWVGLTNTERRVQAPTLAAALVALAQGESKEKDNGA